MVDVISRSSHPVARGAFFIALAAAPGLLFSVFLTVIKFRSSFRCDVSLLSACSSACSEVMNSELATLLGAPISIFSTAYFLVLLGLALAILNQPAAFLAVARPLLLLFAAAGLAVVVILFSYAHFVVGGLCQYCLVIYGLTLSAALGVSLLHTDGYRPSLRALRERRFFTASATQIAVLGLMAAISVQMVWYRTRAVSLTFDERCMISGHLPETPLLTTPAERPRLKIAIFVDLACPHCRDDYALWRRHADASSNIQLAIYYYTRGGDCIPADHVKLNSNAESNLSCDAARATLCAEQRLPGAGLAMIPHLFALQDATSPYFTLERLVEAASAAGLSDLPSDLNDRAAQEHPFLLCLEDPTTLDPIHQHAAFAIAKDVLDTPTTFLIFYDDDGQPLPTIIQISGAKGYIDLDATLEQARQRVLASSPTP